MKYDYHVLMIEWTVSRPEISSLYKPLIQINTTYIYEILLKKLYSIPAPQNRAPDVLGNGTLTS